MNEYDKWNELKQDLNKKIKSKSFKNRDIFWINIGHNIGYETFGKGTNFLRPVLIFKKFSQSTFLGIPLTTSKKEDIFHYKFTISKTNTENYASLTQIRVFDAKRLHHKLDKISTEEFNKLKNQLKELLNM